MIPSDPMILLSYVNLKLRDEYSSLEEMCDKMDISKSEIEDRTQRISRNGSNFLSFMTVTPALVLC